MIPLRIEGATRIMRGYGEVRDLDGDVFVSEETCPRRELKFGWAYPVSPYEGRRLVIDERLALADAAPKRPHSSYATF